ncbi:NTP transferase domain-containing protein [Agrobacterium cavarae]|jgi:choline kinase|uniref:NTP transferase domain-containing protein n=1 Tax=Agrobacterium cavarae TaxID=2528239 RepID=UPI000DDC88B4
MSKVERAIILAAGKGHQLDGYTKVLIRHPKTGKTILDHAIEAFGEKQVTVVVGFRAVQIMEQYPQLDYVVNYDWALTNNAMSLGLALDERPAYVVSGDVFFDRPLIDMLDAAPDNLVLTEARENRTLTAIHCMLRDDATVEETYQGAVRNVRHPEAIGLFKISDSDLLQRWKKLCVRHGNLFVGQTLPCDGAPIFSAPVGDHPFVEINTPGDYLNFMERCRKQ